MNTIMILGSFHMQAKNDVKNFQQTDRVLSLDGDIERIVRALAEFRPTKIAVECEKTQQAAMDSAYERCRKNGFDSPDERIQIGCRLAKLLDLPQVNAVDWMERGAAERGYGDIAEYARDKQPELSRWLDRLSDDTVDLDKESIIAAFRRLNSAEVTRDTVAFYINHARIGSDEYYGNGWLIWWYQRNLNIFANLAALCEGSDNERVLLLIGAAHKGILEQLFRDSLAFEVADPLDYMPTEE